MLGHMNCKKMINVYLIDIAKPLLNNVAKSIKKVASWQYFPSWQRALIIIIKKAVTLPNLLSSLTYIKLSSFRIDLIPHWQFLSTFLLFLSLLLPV